MIHAMPDKAVRVTSRFAKGHGTVFFDLTKANGVTLEADRHDPETLVLRATGHYNDCTARYGDAVEAEADFAELSLMLADRHTPPSAPGHGKRGGWGWKGMAAGLAVGLLGAAAANRVFTLGSNAGVPALHAYGTAHSAPAAPQDDTPQVGPAASAVPPPVRQPAVAVAVPPRPQPPAPAVAVAPPLPAAPRVPAPNFGLQP